MADKKPPKVTPRMTDAEREHYSSHLYRDTTVLDNEKRPSPESASDIDGTSSSARVTAIQAMLNAGGYHCQIDGQYGRQTTAAVERFQGDSKIKVTGVVNKTTAEKLVSLVIQ